MPKRMQRMRRAVPGIPEGCIYVGRPSSWGNPAKIGEWYWSETRYERENRKSVYVENNILAVALFYEYCMDMADEDIGAFTRWILPLAGRDVCCWCSPESICHGDILLYLAGLIKDGEFQKPEKWPLLHEITMGRSF
jgi:hypothetical protein